MASSLTANVFYRMKLFCSNINYKSVLRGVYVSLIRQQHRTTINLRATYDKLPSEQENNHAYGIVQKSLYRYDNAFQKSHDFQNVVVKYDNFDVLRLVNNESYVENLTLTEICHVFMIVTEMSKREERPVVSLEDPNVRILCIRVTKKIPEMKDDQMVNILKALTLWPPTPSTRTPNFKELWNSLDTQCVTRCQTWKNDQLLHVAHLWALLHLSRISLYNVSMIRKLCSHINELDISEVIQLLFFINLQREAPSRLVMTSIEEKLLTHIDTLTVQELSVAALGFFKTKFKMNNQQLLISIMQKLRSNLEHLDEPSLAALLKLLRYSMVPDLLTHYRQVQQALIPRIATCQPQTVIHIILLNSANLVCHHEALTQMIDRFIQDLKSLRLKDISRSLYCLSLFLPRHKMSQKYALQIAEELQSPNRQQEIVEYSVSFLSSVLYLAYMNIFPEKLINQCLTWDFIRILKGNNSQTKKKGQRAAFAQNMVSFPENNYMEPLREAYVLDNSVGLECSDYVGARLSTTLKMTIFKVFQFLIIESINN